MRPPRRSPPTAGSRPATSRGSGDDGALFIVGRVEGADHPLGPQRLSGRGRDGAERASRGEPVGRRRAARWRDGNEEVVAFVELARGQHGDAGALSAHAAASSRRTSGRRRSACWTRCPPRRRARCCAASSRRSRSQRLSACSAMTSR